MQRALRLVLIVAVVVALGSLVAGCASGGSQSGAGTTAGTTTGAEKNTIVMKDTAFSPSTITVKVGDTITFRNDDPMIHDVVIGPQDLGEQTSGTTKTWKAEKAGTFPLKCLIHPSMTGEITVE